MWEDRAVTVGFRKRESVLVLPKENRDKEETAVVISVLRGSKDKVCNVWMFRSHVGNCFFSHADSCGSLWVCRWELDSRNRSQSGNTIPDKTRLQRSQLQTERNNSSSCTPNLLENVIFMPLNLTFFLLTSSLYQLLTHSCHANTITIHIFSLVFLKVWWGSQCLLGMQRMHLVLLSFSLHRHTLLHDG